MRNRQARLLLRGGLRAAAARSQAPTQPGRYGLGGAKANPAFIRAAARA